MKKYLLIILSIGIINCSSKKTKSSKELDVLFIGNSLTYFYDMPQTLQMMLNETHPNIRISQSTFPGMSLSRHLSSIITSQNENEISTREKEQNELTTTEKKIIEKEWDLLILQTGTVSVLIPENRELKVGRAISDIKNKVTNPNCEFILFNTWPSKNDYPKQYCYPSRMIDESIEREKCCSPIMNTLKGEFELINKSYELIAKKHSLRKSNNGSKFYEILTKYPEINLYDDKIHPSKYGSFLNACIFYKIITGNNPSELHYTGELNIETAELLKEIVE